MIIGLAAKKQRGKDTMADHLVEKFGFEKLAFAAPMKASGAAAIGTTVELLEAQKENPLARVQLVEIMTGSNDIVEIHSDISVREYLQKVGTEAHREIPEFGDTVWTDMMHRKLAQGGDYVVTDARFENEQRMIQNMGGYIVQIDRPGMDEGDGHASEKVNHGLRDFIIFNDSTLEVFLARVTETLATMRVRPFR